MDTTTNEAGSDLGFSETPKKRSHVKLILLIIALCFAGLLVLGGAIVALGYFYATSAEELPAKPSDRDVIIDGAALADWVDDFTPQDAGEIFHRLKYVDRVIEIVYEYTDDLDPNAPWTQTTVTFEHSSSDARMSYGGLWIGCQAGLASVGGTATARDDLFSWGDDSHFAILEDEESGPYGNLFVARKGKLIYEFWVSGVYFDDAESIHELLTPVLERAESYKP